MTMNWKLCKKENECGAIPMILRQTPEDAAEVRRFVPTSLEVEWVSREEPLRIRRPNPETKTVTLGLGFTAGGKFYGGINQLCVSVDEEGFLGRDIHGRDVLCFRERFPCFDSYDYLYEHRYYRWFLIKGENTLTLVYYADERGTIEVTEDPKELRIKWWEKMGEIGFCR